MTTVGLSAADAQQAGYHARVDDIAVAAIHAQDYTGWAQMVVDQNRHVIVGMTITCRTSQTCCTQR